VEKYNTFEDENQPMCPVFEGNHSKSIWNLEQMKRLEAERCRVHLDILFYFGYKSSSFIHLSKSHQTLLLKHTFKWSHGWGGWFFYVAICSSFPSHSPIPYVIIRTKLPCSNSITLSLILSFMLITIMILFVRMLFQRPQHG